MRDAISMQSYQWLAPATIAPRQISVKSNYERNASKLCRILCAVAWFWRMMIACCAACRCAPEARQAREIGFRDAGWAARDLPMLVRQSAWRASAKQAGQFAYDRQLPRSRPAIDVNDRAGRRHVRTAWR